MSDFNEFCSAFKGIKNNIHYYNLCNSTGSQLIIIVVCVCGGGVRVSFITGFLGGWAFSPESPEFLWLLTTSVLASNITAVILTVLGRYITYTATCYPSCGNIFFRTGKISPIIFKVCLDLVTVVERQ